MRKMTMTVAVLAVCQILWAQANPDPDRLMGAFQTALASVESVRETMVQEPWETKTEFLARKDSYLVSDAPQALTYQRALANLEGATFFVDQSMVALSVRPFDRETKAWVLDLVSTDPAIPWRGQVTYSLGNSTNLAADYRAFDESLQTKTLGVRLCYAIQYRGAKGYWVTLSQAEIWVDGNPARKLASIPIMRFYTFTAERVHPSPSSLLEMVKIEGGTFQMGSSSGGDNDERPVRSVTVNAFQMSTTEVSQAQYKVVMETNPSKFNSGPDASDRPVEQVNWFEAINFCNRLSQLEGFTPVYTIYTATVTANWSANGYRLPTEAEWEYAARGGTKSHGYTYAGSNDLNQVAWYEDNAKNSTQPVGTKAPNELGLYDISGNVWEWCWDWYGSYGSNAELNPRGVDTSLRRVLRGGSWNYGASDCTVASRLDGGPYAMGSFVGFRVVRN